LHTGCAARDIKKHSHQTLEMTHGDLDSLGKVTLK
jgi:hypothetical protein